MLSQINENYILVLLPSDKKATSIGKYVDTNELVFNQINKDIPRGKMQYLYILSNDEIKEGDWCFDLELKRIFKSHKDFKRKVNEFKKIIYTTDDSLKVNSCVDFMDCKHDCANGQHPCISESKLPEPSKEFIIEYIKMYNEQNSIKRVI